MQQSYVRTIRQYIGTSLLLLPSVAAIIRNEYGHTLFQKRTDDNGWSLPAGSIECGESPWEAVVREVYEETGYTVQDGFIRGVFGGRNGFRHTYPNGDQVEYTVIVFECVAEQTTGQYDVQETKEIKFFPLDALPNLSIKYPLTLFHIPTTNESIFIK